MASPTSDDELIRRRDWVLVGGAVTFLMVVFLFAGQVLSRSASASRATRENGRMVSVLQRQAAQQSAQLADQSAQLAVLRRLLVEANQRIASLGGEQVAVPAEVAEVTVTEPPVPATTTTTAAGAPPVSTTVPTPATTTTTTTAPSVTVPTLPAVPALPTDRRGGRSAASVALAAAGLLAAAVLRLVR